MKKIEINELFYINSDFRDLEIFPESWDKRKHFSLYKDFPRPCSALFFICTDMHATFIPAEGKSISAHCGDVVYIPQGIRYHVQVEANASGRIDTYTLNFRLLNDEMEELILSDAITVLTHTSSNAFELYITELYKSSRQIEGNPLEGRRNILKIKSDFYSLLNAVVTSASEFESSFYPIRRGAEALRNEWNKNEKIETYAAMCGISNAYFYQCFREWSGKSPVEYRNLLRLTNAEAMLRYTEMRVNEISELVGFEDPFYFCRIFARHFGYSPQKYRRSFQLISDCQAKK